MAVEFWSHPPPRQQCRKAHAKEPNGVGRYRAVDPQPQTAHGEYRHPDRLEDRALLVLGPTTKKGFDTAAEDNSFNEYIGDVTTANWTPKKEEFADLKHIPRSAQHHALRSMTCR